MRVELQGLQLNIYGSQDTFILDQMRRRKPNLMFDLDRFRLHASFTNDQQHDALGIKVQIRLKHIKMTEASGLSNVDLR